MKVFFKYALLALAISCLTFTSSNTVLAQKDTVPARKGNNVVTVSSTGSDSLKAEMINVKKMMQDGSYTRIPNKDFENIIDGKIDTALRETIKWWLFIIAALISLLGFLVNKYAKIYAQNLVEKKISQLQKENEEKITNISAQYYSSVINSLLDFKTETITKKFYKVEEAAVDDLQSYLTNESKLITKQKKVDIIDKIMSCYYVNDYPDKIKKMIGLIKNYEEKFTLSATTYANAAIAFLDRYEQYGTKDFLSSAIENCDKSIKALPDYGLAFALKIELYTMAISKAFDDAERKQYEVELLKVFKDVENNSSNFLCDELIARFDVDKKNFIGPYIDKLYKEYPAQMKKIEGRITVPEKDKAAVDGLATVEA